MNKDLATSLTTEMLSASLEDYLETILQLVQKKKVARAKDISEQMQVRKSSVTNALRTLSERGLIHYTPYDFITLTEKGKSIAEDVFRRHTALKDFFMKVLAIDSDLADTGACTMEHAIPAPILERFVKFIEFVDLCPRGSIRWVEDFGYYCRHGHPQQNCLRCLQLTVDEISQKKKPSSNGEQVFSLKDLSPGQKAQVKSVNGEGEIFKRLIDMGLTPGVFVTLIRIAPLGDPIEIAVRGYNLSIRKNEAAMIKVVPVKNMEDT